MLFKKELEEIPVLDYPKLKKNDKCGYAASASVVNLNKSGEIIVIDVFHEQPKDLYFRFFSDGKSFLILNDKKEWIKRRSNSLTGYSSISNTEKDLEETVRFFKKFPGNWYYNYSIQQVMETFVSKIYSDRYIKTAESKHELMQKHFEMFPDYPDDLKNYCDNKIFNHTYIFVSKIIKNKRNAACGHCGHEYEVDKKDKPGTKASCPNCKKQGIYKGDWTGGTITEKANICITHKYNNQLIIRWTRVTRLFIECKRKYEFEDYYKSLYLNTEKGNIIYSYQYQAVSYYGWDWYRKNNGSVYSGRSFIYTNNLREVFGEKYYHIDLQEELKNAGEISFIKLLDNLKNIPATEYLVKMKLTALASNISQDDIKNEKGFTGILGINKQYLKMYQKYNVNLLEHKIIEASKTFVSETNFEKLRSLKSEYYHNKDIISLIQQMSFEKFVNYFSKQKEIYQKKSIGDIITYYKDYISMSETLKVDMSRKSIRFPDDIKISHDLITKRFNEVKRQQEDENFKQAIEKIYAGMKEFMKGDYCIVFPKTRSELIKEGQSLNHCVGNTSYYLNHIEGKRMIFFVRKAKEPDKSYFTMEIDMEELIIRQLYGFGNSSAPAEVRKIANDFLKKLKTQNNAERKAS